MSGKQGINKSEKEAGSNEKYSKTDINTKNDAELRTLYRKLLREYQEILITLAGKEALIEKLKANKQPTNIYQGYSVNWTLVDKVVFIQIIPRGSASHGSL